VIISRASAFDRHPALAPTLDGQIFCTSRPDKHQLTRSPPSVFTTCCRAATMSLSRLKRTRGWILEYRPCPVVPRILSLHCKHSQPALPTTCHRDGFFGTGRMGVDRNHPITSDARSFARGHPDLKRAARAAGAFHFDQYSTSSRRRLPLGCGNLGAQSRLQNIAQLPSTASARGWKYHRCEFTKCANAFSVVSETWCSMPSASASADSVGTPSAHSTSTTSRWRMRTRSASPSPFSVRNTPR
jgi:hypothetical protein